MPNKYRNIKTTVDGIIFDSKKEAARYQELKLLEKAGKIFCLKLQPKFLLIPKTTKRRSVTYTADFCYKEPVEASINKKGLDFHAVTAEYCHGKRVVTVVEDVKSPATANNQAYIVKRNLFEYQNPDVEFREIL